MNTKTLMNIGFTVVVLLLIGSIFFGQNGITKIGKMRDEERKIAAELNRFKGENEKLKQEIDRLKHDPAYIESIARRDFGMVKKDELVFKILKDKDKDDEEKNEKKK